MPEEITQITDAEIDNTIKIHPVEAELDATKSSGRAIRLLLKKLRDYFVQEIGKAVKTINGTAPDANGNVVVAGGEKGDSVFIGYADDLTGTGFSTQPTGKKFQSFKTAPDGTANNGALHVGNYVPFGNNAREGVQAGDTLDLAIDFQTTADFVGAKTISKFTNVTVGAQARLLAKGLYNSFAAQVSVGTTNNSRTIANGNLLGAVVGDTVKIDGNLYIVAEIPVGTTIIVATPVTTATNAATPAQRLIEDTLAGAIAFDTDGVTKVSAHVNGVLQDVFVKQTGYSFVPGVTNQIIVTCIDLAPIAYFEVFIQPLKK